MLEQEYVILVDEKDQEIGVEEKIIAHEKALLHRAFSVFIFLKDENKDLQFLLQQRHPDKYHCGGLWTNTCCSHPRPGESIEMAAKRRLKEEMSLETALKRVGSFQYFAKFSNGLTEHEFDHVFVGEYFGEEPILIDPEEVIDYRWVTISKIQEDLFQNPHLYTPWFKPAFEKVLEGLKHWQEDLCPSF